MKKKDIVIFGNGEIADLAFFYFKNDTDYSVKAFCVDDEYITNEQFNKLPILSPSEIFSEFPYKDYLVHVALSYKKLNSIRKEKFDFFKRNKYNFASYISSKSVYWNDFQIGRNCFILENQTIQPKVKIGDNVMLWSGNHIGHGSVIGNHTYLSSHVVISGNCKVGEKCFFGVNSTVKDFTVIGNNCFIGMDSSVTKNLKNNSFVVSPRSTILDKNNKISILIKKNYFKF